MVWGELRSRGGSGEPSLPNSDMLSRPTGIASEDAVLAKARVEGSAWLKLTA